MSGEVQQKQHGRNKGKEEGQPRALQGPGGLMTHVPAAMGRQVFCA